MSDEFIEPGSKHVWLQVEADRDEELVWIAEQLRATLGTEYQVIVTSDRVETMSRKEAQQAIGKLLAAAGMNLDDSIRSQISDVTEDEE